MTQKLRALDAALRAKYSADELDAIGKKGNALKNEKGNWSYPIDDHEDFQKAVKAVGRGGSDHDKIRAHIIKVAKKKGWGDEIPDNWNSDGSLKSTTASGEGIDWRSPLVPNCPNCNSGKMPEINGGGPVCPDCNANRDADGSTDADEPSY